MKDLLETHFTHFACAARYPNAHLLSEQGKPLFPGHSALLSAVENQCPNTALFLISLYNTSTDTPHG